MHRSYDALQYPLMFWHHFGYHFELRQINPTTGIPKTKKISAMDFYGYRLMMRFNILLRCKDLFHQFIVDMYGKIEAERLRHIRFNQRALRVEQYAHLNDGNVDTIGQLII